MRHQLFWITCFFYSIHCFCADWNELRPQIYQHYNQIITNGNANQGDVARPEWLACLNRDDCDLHTWVSVLCKQQSQQNLVLNQQLLENTDGIDCHAIWISEGHKKVILLPKHQPYLNTLSNRAIILWLPGYNEKLQRFFWAQKAFPLTQQLAGHWISRVKSDNPILKPIPREQTLTNLLRERPSQRNFNNHPRSQLGSTSKQPIDVDQAMRPTKKRRTRTYIGTSLSDQLLSDQLPSDQWWRIDENGDDIPIPPGEDHRIYDFVFQRRIEDGGTSLGIQNPDGIQ